jgi:hypothetical protein
MATMRHGMETWLSGECFDVANNIDDLKEWTQHALTVLAPLAVKNKLIDEPFDDFDTSQRDLLLKVLNNRKILLTNEQFNNAKNLINKNTWDGYVKLSDMVFLWEMEGVVECQCGKNSNHQSKIPEIQKRILQYLNTTTNNEPSADSIRLAIGDADFIFTDFEFRNALYNLIRTFQITNENGRYKIYKLPNKYNI